MKPSRILLIASNFPPVRGGSASVYANLARHLRDRLLVLAPTHDYADGLTLIGWREHDRKSGYRTVRLPLLRTTLTPPPRLPSKWLVRGWDAYLRTRVLAVVAWSVLALRVRAVCVGELLSMGWLLPLLRYIPGISTVVYVHGEEITTMTDPADRRRARRSLLCCDRIVVVSSFTDSALRGLIGPERADRILLIQNGVNTERFRPGPKRADLVESYGLAGSFVFISVSRLVEKKGHDNTIRAMRQVVARFPDTRLLIVGSGPNAARLEDIRDAEGLHDQVIFAGAVSEDDLVSHYLLGDVFIMPNRVMPDGDTEGFGLVFLEANSCGLPVIAGKDGGSTEAVDHGYNGLIVDGSAVDQIADAMLALRGNANLRESVRENGMKRAATSDWATKAALFEGACAPYRRAPAGVHVNTAPSPVPASHDAFSPTPPDPTCAP